MDPLRFLFLRLSKTCISFLNNKHFVIITENGFEKFKHTDVKASPIS